MYGRERMRLLGMVVVLMLAVGAWCSNIYSCIDSVNGTVTPGAGRCSTTVSMSTGAGVVAFCSAANNLVASDSNGKSDIFVRYPFQRITKRVSVSSTGVQANGDCFHPAISVDGRFVAFDSNASNLVTGDHNGTNDVFVADLQTGKVIRVSVGANKVEANGASSSAAISGDGRYIAFESTATNLDGYKMGGVFVYDQSSGSTFRASYDTAGKPLAGAYEPAISANGSVIAFSAFLSSGMHILVRDRAKNSTEYATINTYGVPVGGDDADTPVLSSDGRYVAFTTKALLVPGITGIDFEDQVFANCYVRDRVNKTTELVNVSNVAKQGVGWCSDVSISADGRYVAYSSAARTLVPNDTNKVFDVFVRDRANKKTTRISVSNSGVEGNADSFSSAIDPSGNWAAFLTDASNLLRPDSNASTDIVLTQRAVTASQAW